MPKAMVFDMTYPADVFRVLRLGNVLRSYKFSEWNDHTSNVTLTLDAWNSEVLRNLFDKKKPFAVLWYNGLLSPQTVFHSEMVRDRDSVVKKHGDRVQIGYARRFDVYDPIKLDHHFDVRMFDALWDASPLCYRKRGWFGSQVDYKIHLMSAIVRDGFSVDPYVVGTQPCKCKTPEPCLPGGVKGIAGLEQYLERNTNA